MFNSGYHGFMNAKIYKLKVLFFLSLAAGNISAQVVSGNIVGYVNTIFLPGDTLFENPLDNGVGNLLSDLITSQIHNPVPNGTSISLWNSTTSSFGTTSTYNSGSWSINLTLEPGTGAKLDTPLGFTNTFVGTVLNHDGSVLQNDNPTPPPVFTGPNGIYLLGDACPTTDTGTDIFLNILGRLPNVGEQVTLLDNATQIYTTSTYLGNGNWDNVPTLNVGEAAFLNIKSVPEPSVLSLSSVSILFFCWRMKRRPGRNRPNYCAM